MKKVLALVFAAMMVLSLSVALADSNPSPSKHMPGNGNGPSTGSSSGAPAAPAAGVVATALSEAAKDALAAMQENVNNNQPAVTGVDGIADDDVPMEATGIKLNGDPTEQDAEFSFATKFEAGKALKALVTCFDAAKAVTAQFVLPAEALENGNVKIHFTTEALTAMAAADSTSITIFQAK